MKKEQKSPSQTYAFPSKEMVEKEKKLTPEEIEKQSLPNMKGPKPKDAKSKK